MKLIRLLLTFLLATHTAIAMKLFKKALNDADYATFSSLVERHPDHAMSYHVVPDGFVVKMWTIDNVNDITYGPFAIKPEYRQRIEERLESEKNQPCPIGDGCPESAKLQDAFTQKDWNGLNEAVHVNQETTYQLVEGGLLVTRLPSDDPEDEDAQEESINGPFAFKPEYRNQMEEFVRKNPINRLPDPDEAYARMMQEDEEEDEAETEEDGSRHDEL